MRKLLPNLGLALVSVLVTLLAFEVGLRLAGYRAIYEVYSKPSAFWRHDDLLGWSHEPGARGTFVGPRPWPIEFRTPIEINTLGLRGPEIGPREAGELRVLVLGDSMTAAFEVPYAQTFVALLEEDLSRRLARPVRTINAGVRGYGTDQTYLYFRERGRELEPDLVVHVHAANDARNNVTIHRMRRPFAKPAFVLEGDALRLVGSPVPEYPACSQVSVTPEGGIRRLESSASRLLCGAQLVLFDHSSLLTYLSLRVPWDRASLRDLYYLGMPRETTEDAGGTPEVHPTTRLTTALVLRLADAARAAGARFVLVSTEAGNRDLDLEAVRAAAIPRVEFSLAQLEHPRAHRFRNDYHYNARGHRAFADALLPTLEAVLQGEAGGPRGDPEER